MPIEIRMKAREGPIIIWVLKGEIIVQTPTFMKFPTRNIELKNVTEGWVAGEEGVVMCG